MLVNWRQRCDGQTHITGTADLNVGNVLRLDFGKVSRGYCPTGDQPSAVAIIQAVSSVSSAVTRTHETTICSTLPILDVPSPSSDVVAGGPHRQKSSTLLT
jgi:hypothetical protein